MYTQSADKMTSLNPRHSFSTIHEDSATGWNWCMSKSYCKWPAIISIVVACIVFLLAVFCCLRCCGCLGGRRRGRKNNNQPSMFNPMPYQGYQPANNNVAPPPFGQTPAQFAQFESSSGGYRKGVNEDSLPAMPSWKDAQETRIPSHDEEQQHGVTSGAGDVELGNLRKPALAAAATSSTHLAPDAYAHGGLDPPSSPFQQQTHQRTPSRGGNSFAPAEADSRPRPSSPAPPPIRSPYNPTSMASPPPPPAQQHTAYTGPDFSTPPAPGHMNTQYTGPDFSTPPAASAPVGAQYTAYNGASQAQELGTTPSVLQAGIHPGYSHGAQGHGPTAF